MTRALSRFGAFLMLVSALGACATVPPVPSSRPVATPSPVASSAPVSTASSPPSTSTSSSPSSGPIVVDETLVAYLPVAVAGIDLVTDPVTAAAIAADPALARSAASIGVAYAVAPGASDGDDVAVASVIQLKPGIFNDEFFRSWRDSYDRAACDVAGGTAGNAEAEIAGRTVHIGSCAAGVHTYHIYLEAHDVLVSVTSVGARRLGEQVVAGLRE